MQQLVYYVATSIDGYIAGEGDDISGFAVSGNGVDQYLQDLQDYKTVIMGRKTYEFGYKYGMSPGAAPYPHMEHFIFSDTLELENKADNVHIRKSDLSEVNKIIGASTTDIYLCGGGKFAGWLLESEKIDILKLKINPLVIGQGIKLFGGSQKSYQLDLLQSDHYDDGLTINTYKVLY